MTTRDSSRNGKGRSSTALTTLKMAVFAAMPSAIVVIAMAENPGVFSNVRTAYLKLDMLLSPQRLVGIDLRRTPRRDHAGGEGDAGQECRRRGEHARIRRADADDEVAKERRGQPRADEA